jgi:hypothetical protein
MEGRAKMPALSLASGQWCESAKQFAATAKICRRMEPLRSLVIWELLRRGREKLVRGLSG